MADRTYLSTYGGTVDGTTPEVAYLCSGGQDNTLRRTGIIYPDAASWGLNMVPQAASTTPSTGCRASTTRRPLP